MHSNVPAAPTAGPTNFAAYGAHPGPSYVHHPSQSSQFNVQLAQAPKKGLEDTVQQLSVTLQQFMQGQATLNNQNSLAINDIRTSLKRLTTSLSTQENDIPAHEPYNSSKVSNPSKKDEKHVFDEHEKVYCPIPAPFPQRLVPLHKDKNHVEILEVFRQVRINIPLLDAIQQIHAYSKFVKDLCTVKRRLNVHKKAFLIEQVTAIIQSNTPPKYKDLGAPTIACLGLGELKSTPIILQIADRSIKMPRVIAEDVLVQVDKFYYPVDFAVLDMKLQPRNLEEVHKVNLVENILDEDFHLNLPSTDLQLPLESVLSDLNKLDDISNVSFAGTRHGMFWQPKFEELPPLTAPIKPSSDVIPDLDLKSLPAGLKYVFLGLDDTFPVIEIAPEDQEKTAFTCPFGTFAFRRMPFDLCNAPGYERLTAL
ncbi:uncharacterized protein LOC121260147 [Juglans microcarpa x Juglans regia]|uniref:uncharacterized protein LOC121260147 n=1 Tax=Juglans microcarpa x Juglans regia TaxID=2249226 RepID=UPI001B7E8247|nr:uncharacterized protein LOC121260147 [Juglans microcarpa x Juglans regia]